MSFISFGFQMEKIEAAFFAFLSLSLSSRNCENSKNEEIP